LTFRSKDRTIHRLHPNERFPLAGAGLYEFPVEALDPSTHPTQRVSPCPVCASEEARPRFAVAGMSSPVVVCVRCGLGRFHPSPGPEEVRAFYPDEYYGEPGTKFQPLIEGLVRLVGARHIGFLSRDLVPGARVLDIGCGRGVLLGALADRGFEVHGVEISPEAARGADPRAEIRVASKVADAGYEGSSFDEVIIWHVFEHMEDPRGTLEEVRRLLKPGGRVVIAVPNFESAQARWTGAAWFHLDLPRHLYHFPLPALREMLEQTDFEVISEHHFSLRQNPFGWMQSVLNRVRGLPRNGLYLLLHQRSPGEPLPFDAPTRFWLRFWLLVGAPLGLLATIVETIARSGATVHVVARKRTGEGTTTRA
jgi:2-polyprenyl-3-methyl-5-hydroxy-6-metoxy-1,4-benzoquinol methylase